MRWAKLFERYSLSRKPTLKAVNPRFGTSVIPLDDDDSDILFNYLQDKVHALYFDGDDDAFYSMITEMEKRRGLKVHKMNVIEGRTDRLMHLHLEVPGIKEIRRVVRLQAN